MRRTDENRGDWKEWRRLRAWELAQAGWPQQEMAEVVGASEGAVSQWIKMGREQGEEGLRGQVAEGPAGRLSAEQEAQLPALRDQGAEAHGFRGNVWTTERVAAMLEKPFGVQYHPAHMSRLLRRIKYRLQTPVEKASQRNDEAIAAWKDQHWPELTKSSRREGRTIVCVDEAGFSLLPMGVRTYAPIGQTPILRVPLTRDPLSAIGGITPDGRLFRQTRPDSSDSEHVLPFLQMLWRTIPGTLLVIWDGSPIHRSKVIRAFLANGAGKRLHLERLPGYAPDLNPHEGVWNLLKRREWNYLCCHTLSQLQNEVVLAKERLRHRRHLLQACFFHALGTV